MESFADFEAEYSAELFSRPWHQTYRKLAHELDEAAKRALVAYFAEALGLPAATTAQDVQAVSAKHQYEEWQRRVTEAGGDVAKLEAGKESQHALEAAAKAAGTLVSLRSVCRICETRTTPRMSMC